MEEGMIGSRELIQIILAMIEQNGGDFVVAAEKFDKDYEGMALNMEYHPKRDLYIFTMEEYDDQNV